MSVAHAVTVVHKVTGYDKATEKLEREAEVPADLLVQARRIAELPADVETASGAFPLTETAVRGLSTLLAVPMNAKRYDWFLEPFAE